MTRQTKKAMVRRFRRIWNGLDWTVIAPDLKMWSARGESLCPVAGNHNRQKSELDELVIFIYMVYSYSYQK